MQNLNLLSAQRSKSKIASEDLQSHQTVFGSFTPIVFTKCLCLCQLDMVVESVILKPFYASYQKENKNIIKNIIIAT